MRADKALKGVKGKRLIISNSSCDQERDMSRRGGRRVDAEAQLELFPDHAQHLKKD